MSRTRMTTLPFLLLALSPFVIFDSDNPLDLCPFCKSKTLWYTFMILGRNVEQDQTTCSIQEWQLCLSYFWSYLPLLCLSVIILWFCVHSVSQRPFGIFLWYLVEMLNRTRWHVAYKNDNLPFLLLALSPFVMPPTSKMLERHIASGTFVPASVCYAFWFIANFWTVHARVLKFHIWILHEKITDKYFFLIRIMPLF